MIRAGWRCTVGTTLALGLAVAPGCAPLGRLYQPPAEPTPAPAAAHDDAVYRAARDARTAYLEREVARLQADLIQAEEAMIAIESGLRGQHTRADAVSGVADARIAVERAARDAPWRRDEVEKARAKLGEAERQLRAGHSGTALFFASRAARIAETLNEEAEKVAQSPDTRFVATARANLRAGPSTGSPIVAVLERSTPVFPERHQGRWLLVRTPAGPAGWLHGSVLGDREPGPAATPDG